MDFQYRYNRHGTERKPLVEAVSRILGHPSVYQGAPGFTYAVSGYIIDREGTLYIPENSSPETVAQLIKGLAEQGFLAQGGDNPGEAVTGHGDYAEQADRFSVEIPAAELTAGALVNLRKIVASKENILKMSLEADSLPIVEAGDKLCFPWFTLHGIDGEADAYSRLIMAICRMAKAQKRVTATEKPALNAKYEMRMLLIRLGFIGDEYKQARKILLRNLSGNSS